MGHYINYMTCDNTIKNRKELINAVIDDCWANGDNEEGTSRYTGPLLDEFGWLKDKVFDSYDKAYDYLEQRGAYKDCAVMYREYPKMKNVADMPALKHMLARINKAYATYADIQKKSDITNRKSEFISCPNCESRFKKGYAKFVSISKSETIRTNTKTIGMYAISNDTEKRPAYFDYYLKVAALCPICGHDLRSETTINRINSANDKVNSLVNDYKTLYAKLESEEMMKNKKSSKIRWIAKYEIHC